ncbi:MAG: tRNA (adenosine(37)-N6)-threonylcarbamoyltransferase complex dimerization subunit type 1 TsaB [Tunicatimonas sp.]
MPTILSIETATLTCSVALHRDGVLLGLQEVHLEKSHSSLLHLLVDHLLDYAEVAREALSAVAVSMGPGSYTGLRIGAAAAKGWCFALDIPLIGIDTLAAMAHGVNRANPSGAWLCPMIDARRMEVFCRLENAEGNELLPTQALVVDQQAFQEQLSQHEVWFFGDGSGKCAPVLNSSPNAHFLPGVQPSARWVGELAQAKFARQEFEDLAYSVPHYGKAFYTTQPRKKA